MKFKTCLNINTKSGAINQRSCQDSGANKCKYLWKNFLSRRMKTDLITKFVILTATPYLAEENMHAKEMKEFIKHSPSCIIMRTMIRLCLFLPNLKC